jgi:predicted membrane-bound mannosyltransferase
MHADEAIQADRFATLLEKHSFQYDPEEHHGPLLAYATLPAAWLARQWHYADLTEWTIRAAPALAGIALVLLAFAIAKSMDAGPGAGLAAALFTAVSPVLVYYSRYYIPEMFLVLFSAALLLCVLGYQKSPGPRWAVTAGLCAGLMYATKETAVLAFLAVAAACLAARFPFRLRDLGVAALAAITAAALLLRAQSIDSLRALLIYAGRAGTGGRHSHPWDYYLRALTPAGDIFWLVAGLLAFALLWRRRRTAAFLGTYAAVLTILYTALQYKTPWCAAGPIHAWILTAAVGFAALLDSRWRRAAIVAAVLVAAAASVQAIRYSLPLAADSRNPYAYAHTTRDVYEIRDRVEQVTRRQPSGRETPIDIVAADNWWPLPWYLRRYSQVRWWSAPPRTGRAGPIILCSPVNEDAVARLLYELPPPGQRELYVSLFPRPMGLRPGVEIRGYVAAGAAAP